MKKILKYIEFGCSKDFVLFQERNDVVIVQMTPVCGRGGVSLVVVYHDNDVLVG